MSKVNFKPLNNNVLVQVVEKTVSDGGIILPDVKQAGIITGVVEDLGESFYDAWGNAISINVKVGDTVYFLKREAMEIIPNTGKCLVAYKSLMGKVV